MHKSTSSNKPQLSLSSSQQTLGGFAHKTIWVTGAAQGIGYQVVQTFLSLGARVIGLDCDTKIERIQHNNFRSIRIDITDFKSLKLVCDQLIQRGEEPDILVNAAGVLRLGDVSDLSIDNWTECFDVNVNAVFYLLKLLSPHFKQRAQGSIVNIASNAASVPRLNMAAYCASKAALVSLSHCYGLELAPFNVRCNLVSPGSTDTPMLRSMMGASATQADVFGPLIKGIPEKYKLGIPLKKIASVQEVANAVVFLASDLASHITLQNIVVDGGATLAA
ncbi:MAG: 2,3-dihydro-2,3-dihydroxybenzoate dehydrogenase [Cellvibrio sp.]